MPSSQVVLNSTGRLLLTPLRSWREAVELRKLRRQMPNAHRFWVALERGIRPENDHEYLVRLRQLARERELV